MFDLTNLPFRQKILIGLTIIAGLSIIILSTFDLLLYDTINQIILFYSFGIPLMLLVFDTVIDLNNITIFRIWLTIAIATFIISLTTYNSDKFIIQRSARFDPASGINSLIGNYATSSLKALLIFLIAYLIINKLMNRKGLFVVNTFKQEGWYHNIAKRKITWLDVVTNLILCAVIIAAGLFG